MKLYDISMTISEDMPVYKNYESKKPKFVNVSNHQQNSHYETDITMNVHTGTHVDFNLHMMDKGQTSSDVNIKDYITEARVLDLSYVLSNISKDNLVHLAIKE